MLKRLELIGFKSFAEKTRFDFAPGITAVVGPNGSGKSNVVDAVRWILGEQSAKSLRGGEMADVIFNGSSSRKSLGMAEVTVAFDNTRKLLAVDADEVQITRRVYRDGTGEYLINGQMSRLKDIKEIFLGSGAGSGGYTIIAQGRVDELLQASTKDRREIFDEAAGISRFKAKKLEALRKLLTVESNLTRSRDRLDALDAQLRTLRMQASKAQKYQEYSDRLRELRVGLATGEYRTASAALEVERAAMAVLVEELSGASARTESLERTVRELDWEIARGQESLHHQEARLAEARQLIAGHESTLKHERAACANHEAELLRIGRQRAELGYRLKSLEGDLARSTAELATTEERLQSEQQLANQAAADLAAATAQLAELTRRTQADRERQFDLVRRAGAARSTAEASLAQVARLQKEYTRKRGEIEQGSARLASLRSTLETLSRADADLQSRLSSARDRLVRLNSQRDELVASREREQRELEELRVRQSALGGRIEVLEGLERTLEGLGAGVRDVLQLIPGNGRHPSGRPASAESTLSPLSQVLGLVADLITVPRDVAPLVELALGEAAQRFVVRDPAVMDDVAAAVGELAGRVGFLPLLPKHDSQTGHAVQSLATVVASELPGLPEQLLGNVVLVESLAEARVLARSLPTHRFVSRVGELLEPDGTLTVGPTAAGIGIVSRKSELRELRGQFRDTASAVAAAEVRVADLRSQADSLEGTTGAVETEIGMLSGEAGDLQQQLARQNQQQEQLQELIELLHVEARGLEAEVQRGEAEWVAARLEAEETENAAEALRLSLEEAVLAIRTGELDRDRAQETHTSAQVTFSRAAADRDRSRDKLTQLEAEIRKRKIEAVDLSAMVHTARSRLGEGTLAMLRAGAGIAEAYREKELRERYVAELAAKAAAERDSREQAATELHTLRSGWQQTQAAAHARELAIHDLQARRDAVAARIREDFNIELDQVATEHPADEHETAPLNVAAAHHEVEELRRKLARLGSVNMEALEELTRVETEHDGLKTQHDDLAAARASLQEVIDTINNDSRKLFTDTLVAVRGYFQELFRKLFAGGQADIVLEENVDVLESGIEITARPPGKELRALSLLSGGEKTLTAVALLLAIFRNKPSPFCLLDEVDAALDEANTARLAGVLREFLDHSQFIVITHKKRTMAAADRLWGVTMQESGVSRLLPMRFEDWTDEDTSAETAA